MYEYIREGLLTPAFMRQWKSLLESRTFDAVLVGQDTMPCFKEAYPNEFGVTHDERISYLSGTEARALAQDPIMTAGESRYKGASLDRLISLTAGSPFYLQIFCDRLVQHLNRNRLVFITESGLFLRNLHRWSAHAMVFLVFAHMFKVFYRGAYRAPREFNWVIGVILLLVTLLLSYTGYLLPWDQLAFWAITVGSNIASAVPVLGDKIHFLLLGGHAVNANALLRFYVLHCMILPLTAIFLIAIHFWRIRKDGGLYAHQSEPATLRARTSPAKEAQ